MRNRFVLEMCRNDNRFGNLNILNHKLKCLVHYLGCLVHWDLLTLGNFFREKKNWKFWGIFLSEEVKQKFRSSIWCGAPRGDRHTLICSNVRDVQAGFDGVCLLCCLCEACAGNTSTVEQGAVDAATTFPWIPWPEPVTACTVWFGVC